MTKIVFMGTPDFAVPVLKQLISDGYGWLPLSPSRTGRWGGKFSPSSRKWPPNNTDPVLQPEKLRDSEELEQIIKLEPDLIVTAAYGQILPKNCLMPQNTAASMCMLPSS